MSSFSWSDDLPEEILLLIVKKVISSYDFMSFGQVCSSWRSISKQDRQRFRPVLPGILTRKGSTLEINPFISCRFFQSLSKLKRWPTLLPLPKNDVVCGSHQGWIVVNKTYPQFELTLMNPLTQVQSKLPFAIPSRIIFSANPMDYNCYYIIADPLAPLRCCKLGDMKWTDVHISEYSTIGFMDEIYHRGKLYAVRTTGELFVCDDITASPPTMTKLVNAPQNCPVVRYKDLLDVAEHSRPRFSLVESGQELLLVCCKANNNVSAGLEVYRLDMGGLRWDRVTNLGEHALFLGMNQSFSLSELGVRGIKGNHIYCIEDSKNRSCALYDYNVIEFEDESESEFMDDIESEGEKGTGKEISVFSLEKSSVEYLSTKFPVEKSLGFWFMPDVGAFSSLAGISCLP